MKIAFDSRTGNVKRFVGKLEMDAFNISEIDYADEPFALITYTTGMGMVPQKTLDFLEKNHKNLVGVASSGNRNWGNNFAKSAEIISVMYGVPILLKFELFGTDNDIKSFKQALDNLRLD
ncbi:MULTISPECIES: class Ib ribonucleoside-diphosphate reductase assembly flavoprotein NrdI [Paenibacillus]|uniref:class Ib ribonucleoside-diphosphate reductase assembly flavoprotein NrdI n=1 Tax=Paenibacillus TaxID=44249 RepID=UPI000F52776A|nr:class Ib ribonucleoside-diphosphate reductase assembly flavoprotein NrdI [Paenibacillus xylanexedens]RPK20028.1 hypothetical protein EDO6_06545 [Paenibacillus xylanexedens]